jgi:hypothetical protein
MVEPATNPNRSVEHPVSQQDDCRFTASPRLLQPTADELGTDVSPLEVRDNAHWSEDDESAVSDPRPAELHVTDDHAIDLGNQCERARLVADGLDRFDYVVRLVAIARLFEGDALDFERRLPVYG